MFGKRSGDNPLVQSLPAPGPSQTAPGSAVPATETAGEMPAVVPPPNRPQRQGANLGGPQGGSSTPAPGGMEPRTALRRSENYYDIKGSIFNALIDAIDLTQLGQIDRAAARDEIRDIVNEIITLKDVVMSIVPRQCAAHERLPAHCQPGRPKGG